jgi:ABC-type spermidine/putrescine transport system permease subunit II
MMLEDIINRTREKGLGPVTLAIAAFTLVFLITPLLAVILISFSASRYLEFPPPEYSLRWYRAVLSDETWRSALLLSTEVALAVGALATTIGSLAAFAFTHQRFMGRRIVLAVALSPIVVPAIVVAVGSYFFSARLGLLETRTALVLSHTVLALPIVLIAVMSAIRNVNPRLSAASRSLGATRFETLWRVTVPAIRTGIVSAFLFAFVTSFDEPVIALFVAGTHAVTLPKRMWDGIQYEIDPAAAAMSAILIVVSAAIVLIAERLGRNRF